MDLPIISIAPSIPSIQELTVHRSEDTQLWNSRRECIERVINEIGQRAFSNQGTSPSFSEESSEDTLEQTDPYFQLSETMSKVVNCMPLGFCWRMKDLELKDRVILLDQKIQQALKTLELLTRDVESGIITLEETPLPSKAPYDPFLESIEKRYLDEGKAVLQTQLEVEQLISNIDQRINYKEKQTRPESYQILEYANDVSVSYLKKNRADYKENTDFFIKQKQGIKERQKALNKAHKAFKQEFCKLGQTIRGSCYVFSDPLLKSSHLTLRKFSPISLLEIDDGEIVKVKAIFSRLLQISKRLEKDHIRSEGPIPCAEQDPLGFILRVVQDWTPCLNTTVTGEVVKFREQKNQLKIEILVFKNIIDLFIENLHRIIKEINTKQEEEQQILDEYRKHASKHTTIVQTYRDLIEAINKRIAKTTIKPKGASEETYRLTALCHDTSSDQIRKNVTDFLDIQELEKMKKEIESEYKALYDSFGTFTDLFSKYQAMKGTDPNSWSRWFQEKNYEYWYPTSQKHQSPSEKREVSNDIDDWNSAYHTGILNNFSDGDEYSSS